MVPTSTNIKFYNSHRCFLFFVINEWISEWVWYDEWLNGKEYYELQVHNYRDVSIVNILDSSVMFCFIDEWDSFEGM